MNTCIYVFVRQVDRGRQIQIGEYNCQQENINVFLYLCICEPGDNMVQTFCTQDRGEGNEDRVVLLHALFTVQTTVQWVDTALGCT